MSIRDQAIIRFPGSGSAVAGNTAFHMYDNDVAFQVDCFNSMIWAARRLGYPSVAIELIDI